MFTDMVFFVIAAIIAIAVALLAAAALIAAGITLPATAARAAIRLYRRRAASSPGATAHAQARAQDLGEAQDVERSQSA